MGTAQRDVSDKKKTTREWGRGESERTRRSLLSPFFSFSPYCFFSRSFLRAALHYPNAWNRLHLHKWKRFFLTGFILSDQCQLTRAEDLLLQHAAKDRTSFVRESKRNQGAAKKTSARELTANFHSIF